MSQFSVYFSAEGPRLKLKHMNQFVRMPEIRTVISKKIRLSGYQLDILLLLLPVLRGAGGGRAVRHAGQQDPQLRHERRGAARRDSRDTRRRLLLGLVLLPPGRCVATEPEDTSQQGRGVQLETIIVIILTHVIQIRSARRCVQLLLPRRLLLGGLAGPVSGGRTVGRVDVGEAVVHLRDLLRVGGDLRLERGHGALQRAHLRVELETKVHPKVCNHHGLFPVKCFC